MPSVLLVAHQLSSPGKVNFHLHIRTSKWLHLWNSLAWRYCCHWYYAIRLVQHVRAKERGKMFKTDRPQMCLTSKSQHNSASEEKVKLSSWKHLGVLIEKVKQLSWAYMRRDKQKERGLLGSHEKEFWAWGIKKWREMRGLSGKQEGKERSREW